MDVIANPDVAQVVLMFASQTGKTEVLLNYTGFRMALDPAAILLVEPTLDIAQAYSKDRLSPMIRSTPSLAAIIPETRTRDSENTVLHKVFPGGHITLAGANSPSGLASRPIEVLLMDEVDRYDSSAGNEGDPIELAEARLTNFWQARRVMVSSPGDRGLSKIEKAFDDSDRRRFLVPCPFCGEYQALHFGPEYRPRDLPSDRGYLSWEKDDHQRPVRVRYLCLGCGKGIPESAKSGMLAKGYWEPTAPFMGIAGFHLSALYSPWFSWSKLARQFWRVKADQSKLKVFVNTRLAELWEERGEVVDATPLFARREVYPAPVPAGALVLTAGVDVQEDRVEVEVVGWGVGEESWSIAYRVLFGDTGEPDVWNRLDAFLSESWKTERGGDVRISTTCVDTGHRASIVYGFCRARAARMVYPVKGDDGWSRPIVSNPMPRRSGRNRRPVKLWIVGVDPAKAQIYSRLRMTDAQAGFCHFPLSDDYDEEHFAQMTAEKIVTRYHRGFARRAWVKVYPRNEVLDCRVYAYAALQILAPPWAVLDRRAKAELERSKGDAPGEGESTPRPPAPGPKRPVLGRRRSRGGFVSGWK
jgi:phage terminase large subunit GpA-like protein